MDKSKSEILGNHIRDLRKEKKVTQVNLGKLTHIPASTISYYESGKRRIDAINFLKICRALNVSPDAIEDYLENYISN